MMMTIPLAECVPLEMMTWRYDVHMTQVSNAGSAGLARSTIWFPASSVAYAQTGLAVPGDLTAVAFQTLLKSIHLWRLLSTGTGRFAG